jgi:3-methyladenine DNA glycosylase AlkD
VDRIEALAAALEARRDPAQAITMAAYMKDHFAFFGLPSPEALTHQ